MDDPIITILASAISGGTFVKLIEILMRRGVGKAEEKNLVVNIQGDLLHQLESALQLAAKEREETQSCRQQYDELREIYIGLKENYESLTSSCNILHEEIRLLKNYMEC